MKYWYCPDLHLFKISKNKPEPYITTNKYGKHSHEYYEVTKKEYDDFYIEAYDYLIEHGGY